MLTEIAFNTIASVNRVGDKLQSVSAALAQNQDFTRALIDSKTAEATAVASVQVYKAATDLSDRLLDILA